MPVMLIGVVLVAGALGLAAFSAHAAASERYDVRRTLRTLGTVEVPVTEVRRRELSRPFLERVGVPALRKLGGLGLRLTPLSSVQRLRRRLVQAGNPSSWDAERVLAAKVLGGLVVTPLTFAVLGVADWTTPRRVSASLLAGLGAYLVPDAVVRRIAERRQDAIRRELADALDLLAITVEAGLGFDAAMAHVVRRRPGPLASELHRVLQELQLGRSRADALRELGERSNVAELREFSLAMVQADLFGVSIANVLQVQAREMRVKRRQRAEEQAQKVPTKIVFPLVCCIMPALFAVILGPAAITISRTLFRM